MSQYVFAQPFAWGRPTVNAKTIVGFARDRRFKADDTLLFSASALTGFVSGEHLTSANFETVRAAFAKVLRDAKSAAPALVLPVITPEGRKVYRVQGGAFTEIPAVPRSGALWVRKEVLGLPFDVYFNETPFCGREKTFEGSDYVVIDPTAYDASRVYPGFCRVVLSGKRRANYVAPETYFDVSATKVNPCGANDALLQAMQTGLKLYMRNSGFTDVTLGLSGGMDSAFVASVAVKALGKDHVHPVLMPGPHTTKESLEDARALAKNLGTELLEFNIEELYGKYRKTLGLEVFEAGLTKQNLQARIRANILMALSNARGWLLLGTSNKSEAAVGYGTLYGDMAGGFNFIGDVFKSALYRVAREDAFVRDVIPTSIFEKEPSAELAPDQKDSDDLPPYETLDKVLREILTGKSVASVKKHFEARLVDFVIKRVATSQFKREQVCPILVLSETPLTRLHSENFI